LERDYWDDVEQYVVVELIKLYPKKNKYTDFDWVTRDVVRKKINTFRTTISRDLKYFIFDNQQKLSPSVKGDEPTSEKLAHLLRKSHVDYKNKKARIVILEFIEDIQYKVTKGELKDEFTEWDGEYLEVVLWLYNLGYSEFDSVDILECMGYELNERNKFNSKLSAFRSKLKKNFEIEL